MLVYCLVPALLDEPVAQAVEQRTFNARVESSSLSRLTHQIALRLLSHANNADVGPVDAAFVFCDKIRSG
jgi:hypothetical protein